MQDLLGRPFLVENASSYVDPTQPGGMDEAESCTAVTDLADCGMALDVNNVHVNATNSDGDAWDVPSRMPLDRVVQLDLARLERESIEAAHAADDAGALSPAALGAALAASTVEQALAFDARVATSVRSVTLRHDVFAWRDRRYADGAFRPPPPALAPPSSTSSRATPWRCGPRFTACPPHSSPSGVPGLTPRGPRSRAGRSAGWRPPGPTPRIPRRRRTSSTRSSRASRGGLLAVRGPRTPG